MTNTKMPKSALKKTQTSQQETRTSISLDSLKGSFSTMRADSLRHLNHDSISNLEAIVATKKKMSDGGIRWADDVDTKQISRLRESVIDNLFYNSTEIADFRYEAFMAECGLDPDEFD